MNKNDLMKIAEAYNFGEIKSNPKQITGGRLHQLWKIDTEHTSYAVKKLNPNLIVQKGGFENFRMTESIATAFCDNEIPVNLALNYQGDPLFEINNSVYMIFKWIEGNSLSRQKLTLQQTYQIGLLLGKLHAADLNLTGKEPDNFYFSESHWCQLIKCVAKKNFPQLQKLQQLLPHINEMNKKSLDANEKLKHHCVISHRDIDYENIIWNANNSPVVIDWELAGLINPLVELLGTALLFSIIDRQFIDKERFVSFINGYRSNNNSCASIAPISGNWQDAYYAVMGIWSGWLEYNLQRFIDDKNFPQSERKIAEREAINTLLTFDHAISNNFLQQITVAAAEVA